MSLKIVVEISDKMIAEFKQEWEEINGAPPSDREVLEFFKEDVQRIYEETIEREGFVDAI